MPAEVRCRLRLLQRQRLRKRLLVPRPRLAGWASCLRWLRSAPPPTREHLSRPTGPVGVVVVARKHTAQHTAQLDTWKQQDTLTCIERHTAAPCCSSCHKQGRNSRLPPLPHPPVQMPNLLPVLPGQLGPSAAVQAGRTAQSGLYWRAVQPGCRSQQPGDLGGIVGGCVV